MPCAPGPDSGTWETTNNLVGADGLSRSTDNCSECQPVNAYLSPVRVPCVIRLLFAMMRLEETMKKILFVILLMASAMAWAEKAPNPADYTTVVHVQSSHLVDVCRGSSNMVRCGKTRQRLDVVINGKKSLLSG